MAEHRRVEPRAIVGTGMATDPERVRHVEEEHQRRDRAWRNAPEKGFGDVLAEAPARGELEDEPGDAPPRRGKRPPAAPDLAAMTTEALADKPAAPPPGARAKVRQKPLPRAIPDPREALLRKQLEQRQVEPRPARTMDTPPTGKTRKPS